LQELAEEGGEEGAVMDRERPSASEKRIPEAWIGQEVMLETTETLSSDLRAAAPVYLEDVNDRSIVMLVTRHHDQSQWAEGVWASFLNQPIEVAELRPRRRGAIGVDGYPQLLFRMGYGPEPWLTPRRPVEEISSREG
jgi:hypothetical protein